MRISNMIINFIIIITKSERKIIQLKIVGIYIYIFIYDK